jgi:hypothetical protein
MKEEARRAKQICPRSSTKPGRQKIRLCALPHPADVCHATVAPLPACPRIAALRLALCPTLSRVSRFTFVLTLEHLPILHSHGNKRVLMGTWWEQKEFDGNKRNLMGIVWELFENKRILMGY